MPEAAAAATIISAVLAQQSSNKATRSSERATDEALKFEREREAQRRKEYDAAMALQKQQWDARQRTRQALARRYGFNLPTHTFAPGATTEPTSSTPKLTLGSLVGTRPPIDPTALEASLSDAGAPPPQTLGDLADWEQWQKYGLS